MNTPILKYHKFKENITLEESIKLIDMNTYDLAHKKDILHRHNFFELQFIWEGSGEQSIDFQDYKVGNNNFFLIRPNQIHKANKVQLNGADILIFKPEYLDLSKKFEILTPGLHTNTCFIGMSNEQASLLKKYIFLFKKEFQNLGKTIVLQGILMAILAHIDRFFNEKPGRIHNIDSRTTLFLQYLEEDYKLYHITDHYAAKLNLSVRHFNNIISKDLGKTASSIIKDRIILEIKRLLSYSTNSHKEIAYYLGFKDPYYMSNFFKNQTGIRPSQFES